MIAKNQPAEVKIKQIKNPDKVRDFLISLGCESFS